MGQKKLIRFEEIKQFPNVFEYPENVAGTWHAYFGNTNPITLELACGKGEYAVGLAKLYPNRNFIGIDIKGNRIWRGAKTAIEQQLNNVAFIRTHIDKLNNYFIKDEVAEIWITFPDPQLRLSRFKKRLTHPKYLRLYQQVLQNNGLVNLKTDSPDLFQFTQTVINLFDLPLLQCWDDVYRQTQPTDELTIKTHYELLDIAQSNKIHYLQFSLAKHLPSEKDEVLKQLVHGRSND